MYQSRLLLIAKAWSIATLLGAAVFLLACESTEINSPSKTPPQNGGILVRAHATDPAGFDPVQDSSINTLDLIAPI